MMYYRYCPDCCRFKLVLFVLAVASASTMHVARHFKHLSLRTANLSR